MTDLLNVRNGWKTDAVRWLGQGPVVAKGMLPLLFLLQASAVSATTPCVPFTDGPAEGMCAGSVISEQGGFQIVALSPAAQAGPAIDPKMRSALTVLLDSQRKGTLIDKRVLAPGATGAFCSTFSSECFNRAPLESWQLDQRFTPNPPYLLRDGRIRIEWVENGTLEYLSFITLAGGKVKDNTTAPAQMPIKSAQ